MQTDYFSLRLGTLAAPLNLSADFLQAAHTTGLATFEEARRAGVPLDQAIDTAEAMMLETVNPLLLAAGRLTDLLAEDFAQRPELSGPPHFSRLFDQMKPLLLAPRSRLADAGIIGVIHGYTPN